MLPSRSGSERQGGCGWAGWRSCKHVSHASGLSWNTVASARIMSVTLSVAETKVLLQEVPAALSHQINDVLLTALVQAFAQWTGERSLLVNLEGHGRKF